MTRSRAASVYLWSIPLVALAASSAVALVLVACGSPEPETAAIDRSSCHTIPKVSTLGFASDGTTLADATDNSYDGYVGPLFKSKCLSCHAAGGTKPDLSSYALAKAQGDASLKDIKAGTMPTSGALPAADQTRYAAWVSAGYPQAATPSGPTYKGQIATLLQNKCNSCHKAGGTKPDLSTYDLAKAQGDASLKDINAGTMPPGAPLAAADKTAFSGWITAGYPVGTDNGTTTTSDATASTPAAADSAGCAATGTGSAAASAR